MGYLVNRSLIPQDMLDACARTHARLCPRQVLGIRIGMLAGKQLGLELPRKDKRLVAIMETDGCAVDGVVTATGCSVGRRTMILMDFGKVAATFVDTETNRAVRIAPRAASRKAAGYLLPGLADNWQAQLEGYQMLADNLLLTAHPVTLTLDLMRIISEPGKRATCDQCGEEIMNEREVIRAGQVLCRACAGDAYYLNAPSLQGTPAGGEGGGE